MSTWGEGTRAHNVMAQPSLNYQPAPSQSRSLRRWRLVLFVIALLAITWKVAPTVARRIVVRRLQDQCLRDAPPPGEAVYDARPDSLPQRQRSDPRFVSGLGSVPFVAWRPPAWGQFIARSGATPSNMLALIAVRRLRSPDGHERLVAVELLPSRPTVVLYTAVAARVFELATPLRPPRELMHSEKRYHSNYGGVSAVFPDPPDPNHPDAVTFRALHGISFTRWRLGLADDDHIDFDIDETPPLTPPPPTSQASSH